MKDQALANQPLDLLLIEDNPGDARLIQAYLEAADTGSMNLTVADSLNAGLESLRVSKYDLVLLDLNLPDCTGLDTLYRVLDAHLEVPVIVLTGMRDERAGIEAIKAGAQDFLAKGPQVANSIARSIRYALERHRLQLMLRDLALRDDLTGLYSRRGFRFVAEQALELSLRKGYPITLLFVDVDGLKRINDRYGHQMGDLALKTTADVVRQSDRASDVIARVGGDEFVILALDCGPEGAEVLAQRRRASSTVVVESLPFDLALSVGMVSHHSAEALEVSDLLRQADLAMYRNKTSGAEPGTAAERLAKKV